MHPYISKIMAQCIMYCIDFSLVFLLYFAFEGNVCKLNRNCTVCSYTE